MTTRFHTLLLLTFTAMAASASGCIVETSGNNNGSVDCPDARYFEVQWLVDNGQGTAPLACAALPGLTVELLLGTGFTHEVVGACSDAYKYNFYGYTRAGIATGDYVRSFRLLRSDTRAELSPGGEFTGPSALNPSMPSCAHVSLTYEFPLKN